MSWMSPGRRTVPTRAGATGLELSQTSSVAPAPTSSKLPAVATAEQLPPIEVVAFTRFVLKRESLITLGTV